MAQRQSLIGLQEKSGDLFTAGEVTVTPVSRVLTVRWPSGAWVWNRPVSIEVRRGGHTERIALVDVTRLIQLSLLGLAVIFFVVGQVAARKGAYQNERSV